jgi:fatty-acyl-CoA synthase
MLGMMQDQPLLISRILTHAARYHGDTELVSRSVEGPIHRYTYAEAERASRRLARALKRLGIVDGDRVGTLAWNTYRHFELYYAISGIGAVCHTINPRLYDDQLVYIINHAHDRLLFVEEGFLPLIGRLRPRLHDDLRIITLTEEIPDSPVPVAASYDELVGAESDEFIWPEFDERAGAALCYTSGTTGRPKGALYTHRSTLLHAFAASTPGAIPVSAETTVCPCVPMFHACCWSVPYIAPMNGAKLVLPGNKLDGPSLYDLFEAEGVDYALGVPTIWLGFEAHLRATGAKCSTLTRVLSGGSAVPPSLIEAMDGHGIDVIQGWGMTEMSPLGTVAILKGKHRNLPRDELMKIKAKQGRAVFGVEFKLIDDNGSELPHDGEAVGELLVRGPWIVSGYFEDEEATRAAVEPDGWFHTGDVATMDPDGYLQIRDRAKDVIKSGGEWISSMDLEVAAMAHEDVAEAAVIAIADAKWAERPLLIVTARPGRSPERQALTAFLAERFPRWMLPDDVVTLPELPHTATGKVMKTRLREMFADYRATPT